jgi:hypothetical protein
MIRGVIAVISAIVCTLLTPPGVPGQGLDLKTPAPQRLRDRFGGSYTYRPPAPQAPGFLAPLSKESDSSRAGIAGWTASNTPVGARAATDLGSAGWLGFGFATEWGGSAAPRERH